MNTKLAIPGYTHHLRGIFLITAAVLTFSVMDALVKYLSAYYTSPFLTWVRFLVQILFVSLTLGPWLKRSLISTQNLKLQLIRSTLMLGTTFFFFSGLRYFTLAEATTVLFISPILLIVISPFLLGERPGKKEWLMVLIGFIGMMIMLRPTSDLLRPAILLPMGAAISFTLFQIITRKLNSENPFTTLFYTGIIGFIVTSFIVPFNWSTPSADHILPILLLGILGATGHFLLIKAFAYAPAPVLAPFIYTQLIWATILGFLFFSEFPDMWSLIGMSIIGITGLISSVRGNFSFMENERRKNPGETVARERRTKIFKRQQRRG